MISPPDRISYFKSVLLLQLKNNERQELKEKYIKRFIRILQFDAEFYDFTSSDIISNLLAIDDPPDFSSQDVAKIFIKDCIRIIFRKRIIISHELAWLQKVSQKNQLGDDWFAKELLHFLTHMNIDTENLLEIEKYV
jgi:hypothetical protein